MEIKLGIGLDKIVFGSTQSEIENILGKPDRIRMDEEYEEFEPMLQYNSIKTRLTFYKNHGGKLGYMRSSNPELHYKNKKIIGKSISEAFDIFDDISKDSWQINEYDFWIDYFNEDWWIILRFDYSEITQLELGVPFRNEDEYNWPK
jgi:hypothetical protein